MFDALKKKLATKNARRIRNGQRGMTLLEIMIVLAILALVMGLIVGPRVMAMFGDSKVKLTDIKVKKFANEAFPQWSMANPSKACPANLTELTKYMNDQGTDATNDAWGKPLKMYCGQAMPPGVSGFAVSSFGENGTDDNGGGDDLASWK
jgi:prepilin-type N-terminal cleavage/methylation domain-containing protein